MTVRRKEHASFCPQLPQIFYGDFSKSIHSDAQWLGLDRKSCPSLTSDIAQKADIFAFLGAGAGSKYFFAT